LRRKRERAEFCFFVFVVRKKTTTSDEKKNKYATHYTTSQLRTDTGENERERFLL